MDKWDLKVENVAIQQFYIHPPEACKHFWGLAFRSLWLMYGSGKDFGESFFFNYIYIVIYLFIFYKNLLLNLLFIWCEASSQENVYSIIYLPAERFFQVKFPPASNSVANFWTLKQSDWNFFF